MTRLVAQRLDLGLPMRGVVERSTREEASYGDPAWLFKACEELRQLRRGQQLRELRVRVCTQRGAHDGARARAADQAWEQPLLEESTRDAPREVGEAAAAAERQARATEDALRSMEEAAHALVEERIGAQVRLHLGERGDNLIHVLFDQKLGARMAVGVESLVVDTTKRLAHAGTERA